ncbi:MAG: hypothetical protein ACT4OV_07360 [Microthrixaceae bacterium]
MLGRFSVRRVAAVDREGIDEPVPARLDRRRMLRLGGLGAASAAAMVANGSPAGAADLDPMVLGTTNTALSPTILHHTDIDTALVVQNEPDGGSGISVSSPSGNGVSISGGLWGLITTSSSGGALFASSHTGPGVVAKTTSPVAGGPAVAATSGNPAQPAVAAYARPDGSGTASSAAALVVAGTSRMDAASAAAAPTLAVVARSGQPALTATGKAVGVNGTTVAAPGHGPALNVAGVIALSRSGTYTLPGTAASVSLRVAGGLSASSTAFATVQSNSPVGVRAAVPEPAIGKVTIYFTAQAPAGTKVAWFVVG